MESHLKHVKEVLELLRKHKFYAKDSKCEFAVKKTEFLGHIVSEDGLATDPKKIQAVTNWSRPTTVRQVRSFLGFASYYRKFIHKFSKLLPL